MSEWQPIDTAKKVEGEYLIGYDKASADAFGLQEAGLCVITWIDADDDDEYDAGWEVMPFCEGLDVVISETNVTHWMPLPEAPKD